MIALNLPEAPDAHFWRVDSVLGMTQVQLRKRFWFFSVEVDSIIPLMNGTNEAAAEWAAQEILERMAAQAEHKQFMNLHRGDQ